MKAHHAHHRLIAASVRTARTLRVGDGVSVCAVVTMMADVMRVSGTWEIVLTVPGPRHEVLCAHVRAWRDPHAQQMLTALLGVVVCGAIRLIRDAIVCVQVCRIITQRRERMIFDKKKSAPGLCAAYKRCQSDTECGWGRCKRSRFSIGYCECRRESSTPKTTITREFEERRDNWQLPGRVRRRWSFSRTY